jgi:uncharacterized damage-inducible protein DinB
VLISDDYTSLYDYNAWANERMLASCRALSPEEYGRALGGGWPSVADTLAHLASATRAWHERFHGRSPERLLTGADLPAFADAASMLMEADVGMRKLVIELAPDRRNDVLAYKNLRGETKKVVTWAVFRHVVNHASYHRGQISSMVRRLGHEPKATDLVLWGILNTPQD